MLILVSPSGHVDEEIRDMLKRIGITEFTEWSYQSAVSAQTVPGDDYVVVLFVSRESFPVAEHLNTLAAGHVAIANKGSTFKELSEWAKRRGIHYTYISGSVTSAHAQIGPIKARAAA